MAQSTGRPIAPMKGKKKHLQDDDLFACTFTDGKTYKVKWKDLKNLFIDKPSVWHIKDLTGGDLPVKNVDAVFDMAGNKLSDFGDSFTIKEGQEVLVIGNDVRFNNRGAETHCNWNMGDQTDTKNQQMWDDMFCHNWGFNGDIQHLDVTEKAFNLQYVFDGCYAFNQPVSHFNTKNANTVRAAFQVFEADSPVFNQQVPWDTANAQFMQLTFNCQGVMNNGSSLQGWKTGKAEEMNSMFRFNQTLSADLRGWCVTKITSLPSSFNRGAPGVIPPVWGTCP